MSKRIRRILITVGVLAVALGVLVAVFTSKPRQTSPRPVQANAASQTAQSTNASTPTTNTAPDGAANSTSQPASETSDPVTPIAGLKSVASEPAVGTTESNVVIGSLDPRVHIMQLEFSRRGASISKVSFADIWETAAARRLSFRYQKHRQPGQPFDATQVDESQRYLLQNVAAAHSVIVNGTTISLDNTESWSETGPGLFQARIADESGRLILEITRQFILGANYDITLKQRLRNLSGQRLDVQWLQNGPTDLAADKAGYIDRRRFDAGYLPDPARQPDLVLTGDFDFERTAVLKRYSKSLEATDPANRAELETLWPNEISRKRGYELSWFASMNRYFSVSVHPSADDVAAGKRSLSGVIDSIVLSAFSPENATRAIVLTALRSPVVSLEAGAERSLDMGLYVGPLDRTVLAQSPFGELAMREMILYSMGGCCTFMSFQWLARLLLAFLSLLHDYMLFDWGLAIMVLVLVVRSLLHPLTRKSQINMLRFGKKMSALKPEIDKLQKKFGSDPKRMQVEQMKLMREHGVNPFQMLGCLPMFLQMPIWIALWAMLYLAFDIRHQPAFYGVFQVFGDWSFLGDLSSPDLFWILPGGGFNLPFGIAHIDALNVLPLLLGVVFFIQQKYMSPPPTPNMTPEQKQQQKIMKIMMVVMFPLFLYKAPSGLTLYIFTSTCIGIMESKYIRAHIDQMDLGKPGPDGVIVPRDVPPKKPKGTLGRMWAEKLEAARAKRMAEPSKTFKKRK